jgi:hypothetical protein
VEELVGEEEPARMYYTQALTVARELGDRRAQAEALWALGHLADSEDHGQAALRHDALTIYEELGVPATRTDRVGMRHRDR